MLFLDGIVGEVLFYTLKSCLGPEYDSATHKVWVKIFSRMLMVIVPVAVTFEMQSGAAQMDRLRAATAADKVKINMFSHDSNSGHSANDTKDSHPEENHNQTVTTNREQPHPH